MIERQIALEREMVDHGIERYQRIRKTAEDAGRGSTTSYSQRLLPSLCVDLADAIEGAKVQRGAGVKAKYIALLKGIDSNQAAFITLKVIFDSLIKGGTVNNLAVQIGMRIEDQIRFSLFAAEHEDYYAQIIADFKNKKTAEYRHKRNVMRHVAKERDGWIDWTPRERLLLGVKLIELTIQSTALIEKVVHSESAQKRVVRVQATAEAMEWIEEHIHQAELLHPEFSPCIIPPCDWVDMHDGGFYTPELRRRTPFVKIKSRAHRAALNGADLSVPMQAVNVLQRTPWRINTRVHDVMRDVWNLNLRIGMPASSPYEKPPCPIPDGLSKADLNEEQAEDFAAWKRAAARMYTAERERVSKSIQLSRVLSMATKYREFKEFYYVYNLDFRGRIYTVSPGLTPQGADFAKGLLEFATPCELDSRGRYWLQVHGANTFGFDKASFDERVRWVAERHDAILAVAADPLSSAARSFWADADDPYQFLAFCFAYGDMASGKTTCHLPISMDGSCNGIQNFSAMLQDSVGGSSTNLVNHNTPSDIYQDVADVCNRVLTSRAGDCSMAQRWLAFGVTRKLTKKPVMTLPYGSTMQSCRESVEDYLLERRDSMPFQGKELYAAAKYMSQIIWDSISEVVVAARDAMAWLQKSSRVMSAANLPIIWHTPTGFRVYQGTMKRNAYVVSTQLMGRCDLSLSEETDEIDRYRQANGIAPNFVHSMDASHLMLTVLEAPEIDCWQMIHDSYGTHASQVDYMRKAIQTAFVDMYSRHDVLRAFKEELEAGGVALPDLPATGTLDLQSVLTADYFFA